MNSQKASDVRDALNGLPCVAYDPEVNANYSNGPTTITRHGVERTHTGPCVKLDDYQFRPAAINKAGAVAFGENASPRPCYEVLLEPLALPTRPSPTISIPPAVVHEIAKYQCRLRVTAGRRGEFTPGTIRIRDDLESHTDRDADTDTCEKCQSTRFTLRNGTPICERCGTAADTDTTPPRSEHPHQ